MGNGVWNTLGIAATTDISAIKSAYAMRAKECHPEEHPEEFKELQNAYKSAVKYAKTMQKWGVTEKTPLPETPEKTQEEQKSSKEKPQNEQEVSEIEIQEEREVPKKEIHKEREVSKKEIHDAQKVPEEKPLEFNYDEIAGNEVKDRFFQEFSELSKNPFLKNDLTCWKVLFSRQEYQRLLKEESFRRNFVLTMCHFQFGWHRRTIRYFDGVLKEYEGDEYFPATGIKAWKRKRNRWYDKGIFSFPAWRISKEQRAVHNEILAQVKMVCGDDNLENPDTMEQYMKCYLSYVYKYQGKMERLEWNRSQSRTFLAVYVIITILMTAMSIYLHIWYQNNPDKHHNYKNYHQEQVLPEQNEYVV